MTDTASLQVLNEQAWSFLRRMIADLNDEQVGASAPEIDERPIAGIVMHAYSGTFLMAHAFSGKSLPAVPAQPTTASELLTTLDSMHSQAKELLASIPEGALEKMYPMPWGQQWEGRQALVGALAHALFHAGAIQGIRALAGFPTPPEK